MIESKFDACIGYVLDAEGGLVNDKDDTGGITNYGITLKAYKKAFPEANKNTITKLTLSDAKRFYNTFYWIESGAEFLPLPISLLVFDMSVNAGSVIAKKILQRALRVTDDGIIGKNTLNALKKHNIDDLVAAYTSERSYYYCSLCTPLPEDNEYIKNLKIIRRRKYLKGWLNRANKMMLNALKIGK